MLMSGSNGNGASTDGLDAGHAQDSNGNDGHHSELHAEGAMKPRTLFSVIVLAGLVTTGLLTYFFPVLEHRAKAFYCSKWPIPQPAVGSKLSVGFFLAKASESERSRFLDSRVDQFRGQPVVDFVSACTRPDEAKANEWLQALGSAGAFIFAEATGRQHQRRVRLNVLFKDGSKSAPDAPFDVDEDFASTALDRYLAEVLLLRPYVKLADEWEQKLQNTIDNKIEYSPEADRLAEEISEVAANSLLQGNCKAQLLAVDSHLFARRPEVARKQLQRTAVAVCSQDAKYAAGLLFRLATVETESARDTTNSSAQRAFQDTALNIFEQLWTLPKELRKEFSSVAAAQANSLLEQRPDDDLKAATLKKHKDRSDEALQYDVTAKNMMLRNSLDQQKRKMSPRITNLENKETAYAEQIRADAEAERNRRRLELESAQETAAVQAERLAEQKASERLELKQREWDGREAMFRSADEAKTKIIEEKEASTSKAEATAAAAKADTEAAKADAAVAKADAEAANKEARRERELRLKAEGELAKAKERGAKAVRDREQKRVHAHKGRRVVAAQQPAAETPTCKVTIYGEGRPNVARCEVIAK
jgi:hypothetical protein